MSFEQVERMASTLLYEGYMLYPYRPSAVKNRQRFNWGVLHPARYSEALGSVEPCSLQSECLVEAPDAARLHVRVRCLQIVERSVWCGGGARPGSADLERVQALRVDGREHRGWSEVRECAFQPDPPSITDLVGAEVSHAFELPGGEEVEPLVDASGARVGALVRASETLRGELVLSARCLREGLFRIRCRVHNHTTGPEEIDLPRDEMLAWSLVSTHVLMEIEDGRFLSLLDPPEPAAGFAEECENVGVFPVLAGTDEQEEHVLCSPIILYDYPTLAPQSPGDLFDGTEIEEILSLRIMTLTDDEKDEMRLADARARRLLERTEAMTAEDLMRMHGVMRNVDPTAGGRP